MPRAQSAGSGGDGEVKSIWIFTVMKRTPRSCQNGASQEHTVPTLLKWRKIWIWTKTLIPDTLRWTELSKRSGDAGYILCLLYCSLLTRFHFQPGIKSSLGFCLLEMLFSQPPHAPPSPSVHIYRYHLTLPPKLPSWLKPPGFSRACEFWTVNSGEGIRLKVDAKSIPEPISHLPGMPQGLLSSLGNQRTYRGLDF